MGGQFRIPTILFAALVCSVILLQSQAQANLQADDKHASLAVDAPTNIRIKREDEGNYEEQKEVKANHTAEHKGRGMQKGKQKGRQAAPAPAAAAARNGGYSMILTKGAQGAIPKPPPPTVPGALPVTKPAPMEHDEDQDAEDGVATSAPEGGDAEAEVTTPASEPADDGGEPDLSKPQDGEEPPAVDPDPSKPQILDVGLDTDSADPSKPQADPGNPGIDLDGFGETDGPPPGLSAESSGGGGLEAEVDDTPLDQIDPKDFKKTLLRRFEAMKRQIEELKAAHESGGGESAPPPGADSDAPAAEPEGEATPAEPEGESPSPPEGGVLGGGLVNIPMPRYDAALTTPERFITEVEEYYGMKGVPKNLWLIMVGRMFRQGSEQSQWYRANRGTVKNWEDFKKKFKAYEANEVDIDVLNQRLFAERQYPHEAFESFVWRIHNMFMKVKPKASGKEIVDRILNSCIPEIAASLIPYKAANVDALIKYARTAITNLNKVRDTDGKPVYRIRKTDSSYGMGDGHGYYPRGGGRYSNYY